MARAMPFICTIAIAHCSGAIKSAGRSASARHTDEVRKEVYAACTKACVDIGYKGAGTFEFSMKTGAFISSK